MVNDSFIDQCRNMETYSFQTFSEAFNRPWGTLLFNPKLLQRHDANHAEVINPSTNPKSIISEIESFYSQRKAPCRINHYDPSNETEFKSLLSEEGFINLDKDENAIFMKLDKKIYLEDILSASDDYKVSFTPSLPLDSQIGEDIEKVLHSDWDYQNLVTHHNYYYFILYDKKEPVSTLSFFLYEPYMLARLDDVVTIPKFRNNGYSSFLLKFACNWIQNNDFIPYLCVSSSNKYAEKMYKKVGFSEEFRCSNVYWLKE